MLDRILECWWQFCVVILTASVAVYVFSKAVESPIKELGAFFEKIPAVLKEETRGETLAGVVDVCIIFLTFILAVGLISPSILAQFGLTEEQTNLGSLFTGVSLFVVSILVSCKLMVEFKAELEAFSNDQNQ